MPRTGQHNLIGPKLLVDDSPSNAEGTASSEKWILAGLLGLFGGSLAYFIYSKKIRNNSAIPHRPANSNRQQQLSRNVDAEFFCIRDLPAEIRTRIWQALPYEDLLSLRLTSRFTKDDVDSYVGLNGRITTADAEKYDFYQRIALSSCRITELQEPIDQDFLLNPAVLQTLEIREHAPIPLSNIQEILKVTINLKTLKLRLILNDNTRGISQAVLYSLTNMTFLKSLHVKTIMNYVPEVKNYAAAGRQSPQSYPRSLKTVHLEMPDLPDEEVAKWKLVLDQQICLEVFICNVGNVSWRYYQQVLSQNSATLTKIALEGLRGWDSNREVEDPLDWGIFAQFSSLKSADLACNRGGDNDVLPSINFQLFPCGAIEEFFISRITLSPEAVERVYNDMSNLQRGALDHIGNGGIERANEMAWLLQHAEDHELSWYHDERFWDILAHGMFGLSMAFVLTYVVKARVAGYSAIVQSAARIYNNSGGERDSEGRNANSS